MPAPIENSIGEVGISTPPADTKVPLFRQQYPEYNSANDDDLMRAVHEKMYSSVPYDDFAPAFIEKYTEPKKEDGIINTFVKGVKGGLNGIDIGIYGMLNRIGGFAGGWDLSEFEKNREENAPDESAQFQTIIEHPTTKGIFKWLAYQAGSAVPWIPAMMIPELGGTALGSNIAWSAGAGTAATKMLQIGGGALASALTMSTISAGDVYQQALQEGKSEEEASSSADQALAMSMPVNVIGGAIQAGKLLKGLRASGIPITESLVKKTVGLSLKDLGITAVTGAIQLSGQSIAANIALDHPWNEGLAESAVSGGVLGLGMGGASELMGRLGKHSTKPINRKMQELKMPDETGKVPESPEGAITPTPEEIKMAEQSREAIKNINEPQTIEEQISSIKNQLSTNPDGTKDRVTVIRLGAIEGHLEKMGVDRNGVLAELSDLYNKTIGVAEHENEIVKITNESKPQTPVDVVNALTGEPKAVAPTTLEDFVAKAEEVKANPDLSEDAKTQALKVLEENKQGAKSIEAIKGTISEEDRPLVDAIFQGLAQTRGTDVNSFINSLVKPENVKIDQPIEGTTLKQSVPAGKSSIDYTKQGVGLSRKDFNRIDVLHSWVVGEAWDIAKLQGRDEVGPVIDLLHNMYKSGDLEKKLSTYNNETQEILKRYIKNKKELDSLYGRRTKAYESREMAIMEGGDRIDRESKTTYINLYNDEGVSRFYELVGRESSHDVKDPITGETIIRKGQLFTVEDIEKLEHRDTSIEVLGVVPTQDEINSKVTPTKIHIPELILNQGEQDYTKGAVQLRENGKNLLYLYTGKLPGTIASDALTIAHEMFHLTVPFLNEAERALIERHEGKKISEWMPEQHEKYAGMFTDYLLDGKAPNKGLQPVFDKIKEFLYNVYKKLTGIKAEINIPDDIRKVFDSMLDVEKNKKLQEDYRQSHSDFLAEHGERIVDGKNKQIGFFKNINPQDREYLHSQLKSYGYQSEDMINGDIAYYQEKTDAVNLALVRRMKEADGTIAPKEFNMLKRAEGHDYETARMETEAWVRSAIKEQETPKTPRPKKENITPIEGPIPSSDEINKQFTEAFDIEDQSFTVQRPGQGLFKDNLEISDANKSLIAEAEKVRVGDKDNPPNPELAEALIRVAKEKEDNPVKVIAPSAELTELSFVKNSFDKINQYNSAAREIANATSLQARNRLRELYNEHLNWIDSDEGKQVMDIVSLDPDFTYPTPPMSEQVRAERYSDLGISKMEGDRLTEETLDRMMQNKNITLFQKTSGVPDDKEQGKIIEVGKVITRNRTPLDTKTLAKEFGVTPDQVSRKIMWLYRMVGMPQMIAGSDPYGFGKVWKLGNHLKEVSNGIASKYLMSPDYLAFKKKGDEHIARVMKLRVDGTTWGVSSYDAIEGKMSKPWESKDWITDKDAKQMVKDGQITQEDADAIKSRQDNLRSQYSAKDKSVGKVFSENEVKSMGYSQEEYNDYKMLVEQMDGNGTTQGAVSYWKKSAIMNGMSPGDAEKTFGLTGYHPLGRGEGKWVLEYKDPTSPTGYTFSRFESVRDAERARLDMIDKGVVSAKDPTSDVHEIQDHIVNYGKYLNDHDLAQLIEEAGDFNGIQERLKDPKISEEEKQILMGQNELANSIKTEWKKRGYSSARTIPRGNVGMIIDPKSMINEYETFIRTTASRYSNALGKAQLSGMTAELAREVSGESYKDSATRRAMAKYANQYIDDITKYNDPLSSKMWDKLRDAGFLWSLAFNASNGIINSTQPLITDIPEMHKWRQSSIDNGKLLIRSEKEAWKLAFGGQLSSEIKADYPGLHTALNEWHSEGKLKASFLEETVVPGSMPENLRQAATFPQSKSENKNRIGSSIRGYILATDQVIPDAVGNRKLAKELASIAYIPDKALETIALKMPFGEREGMTNDLLKQVENELYSGTISQSEKERIATKFGGKFSDDVNFIYGSHNRPKFITSAGIFANPLKSAFLFKGFTNSYIGFFVNHMMALEPDKSVGYNLTHNLGHKAVTLAPLLALSGLVGLPFANDIKTALKTAGITDADKDLRELIGNNTYSDMILKGLPALLPNDVAPDLSRRIGVGDVLPQGLPQGSLSQGIASIFLGAPAQMVQNFSIEALKDFSTGNYTSAYQKMSPVFVNNIIKAVSASDRGLVTRKGEMLLSPDKVSTGEAVIQGIGFSPMHFTEARDFEETMKYAEESRKSLVSGFNERMARAIASGDQSEVQDVLDDIVHHNAGVSNPEEYYNFKKNLPSIKARYAEMTTENGLKRTPKAMRSMYQRTKPLYTGE